MNESSAPQMPTQQPPGASPQPPQQKLSLSQQSQHEPAGFWRRFAAVIIDGIIINICIYPLLTLLALALGAQNSSEVLNTMGSRGGVDPTYLGLSYVIQFTVMFFYFGWFYKNMGGTPGKLALKLAVVRSADGQRLGYGRSFLRETLGKFASGFILGIGFFMAAFRGDKRALHDLISDTQVIHIKDE